MRKAVGFDYQTEAPGGAQGYIVPFLLKLLAEKQIRGKILDIGCGNGSMARTLEASGHEVWGCEWDPAGVEIANRAKPRRFMRWDLNDPHEKFPWSEFQAVISSEVIEHLFLPRNLFRLVSRVLKPGGLVIVTTPYHGYLKNLVICLAGKWDRHHDVTHDGGHIKFFSPRTLGCMMKAEGFQIEGWKGCGRLPALWKSMVMWGRKIPK
jgi:2-polyprenyl-3-methyl-5-hydroxy-6-metoxy-1,4-benzoquinol methylase